MIKLQQAVFKLLMLPATVVYAIGVSIHNAFYRWGVLKGLRFNIPIISVGNLSVGGTGKTPHIEYLIKMLKPYLQIAVLSRGYRRKTKGFRYVDLQSDARQVGDEPYQYKQKFEDITIAVAERRAFAIPQMISHRPGIQTILLDDAFQHRAISPGLNILLTSFDNPFTEDYLLPLGRLREWRSGYKRADVIIVTKCPEDFDENKRQAMTARIKPLAHQKIFFSKYNYLSPYALFDKTQKIRLRKDLRVVFLCAIANTDYLSDYLDRQLDYFELIAFEDHHYYSEEDIKNLHRRWNNLEGKDRIILTTEKDASRLKLLEKRIKQLGLPIFVLPVELSFLDEDEEGFVRSVQQFLLDFKV